MVSFVLIVGLVVIGIFFINSVNLSDLVNDHWPPISTLDQRYHSIEESVSIITKQGFITDVLVSISESDLKKQALPLIENNRKKIENIKINGISNIKLNDVMISFLPQGITAFLDVQFKIDNLDLTIGVTASGDVAIVPKENGVVLKPALTNLEIKPVSRIKGRWLLIKNPKDKLLSQLTTILESLLVNINGVAFKNGFHIPFDLSITENFSPKKIKTNKKINITGDDIPLKISLPSLAVYVNESSLNILGSTANQPNVNSAVATSTQVTEELLLSGFQKLTTAVNTSLFKSFGDEFSLKKTTSTVVVRKGMLSSIINKSLNSLNIGLSMKDFLTIPKLGAPDNSNKFSQDIAVHDKQTLPSCKGLYRDFHGEACDNPCSYAHIICEKPCNLPDCNKSYSLPSCDYGCKWSKPKRCAKEAACKVERETKRAAYDVKKAACKVKREAKRAACDAKIAACKVDRETRRENCKRKNTECKTKREIDRLAHQAENELRVAKCKGKKAALKLVDGLVKLGELEGEYWVNNSRLHSVISSINVTDKLSGLTIKSSINSSLDARLRIWVNSEGLGHIACLFSFRKTLKTHAVYQNKNLVLKGIFSHKYNENGNLVIIGKTLPLSLSVKLSPSPYSQLIKDPGFLINCTLLNMVIPTVAGAQLLKEGSLGDEFSTLFGRAKIDIEEQEFPFVIQPITIGNNDESFKLVPKWGDKLIKFDFESKK